VAVITAATKLFHALLFWTLLLSWLDEQTVEQLDPGAKIRDDIQGEGQKMTDESY
jgi:hypothetical protein